jgi:DNA repair exonuclease SbcCD ATPase subunit
MRIKKIEWRNVASYGNKIQKLELPEKSGLIQVFGENGSGKSTISDVITFGLYGKLEGKKLKDIPNRSNGSAWMKITFEQDGKTYEVERGLDPNTFNLSIDGSQYDRAGQRNVQDFLAEDILKIPYYVFNNTISLSINDFKSFLKMSVADKKLIIDKIFGFYILNEMRDILKEEAKTIRSSIDRLSGEIFATGRSISNSQKELEDLQRKLVENAGEEIEKTEEQLENYENLLSLHTERLKSFKTQENEAQRNVTKSYESLSDVISKIKELDSKMNLYNNDKCPTCTSDLTSDFHKNIFDDLASQRENLMTQSKELKKNYDDAKVAQNDLSIIKNDLFTKGGKIESGIRTLQEKLKNLKTGKNNDQVNSIKKLLSTASEELSIFNKDKGVWEERQTWIKTLDEVLSEKGVKQLAIKSILPSLNKEILTTLLSLHLPYKVVFNEEFNAQIFHLGEEISPQTLSTGEMKKVDFAVLVAIIKLMKIRFSSVNILFLDEIFSSVDPDGIHTILGTLRKLSDDLHMNIFVINHAPMPTEIFDYKIEISKKNNFSDTLFEKLE